MGFTVSFFFVAKLDGGETKRGVFQGSFLLGFFVREKPGGCFQVYSRWMAGSLCLAVFLKKESRKRVKRGKKYSPKLFNNSPDKKRCKEEGRWKEGFNNNSFPVSFDGKREEKGIPPPPFSSKCSKAPTLQKDPTALRFPRICCSFLFSLPHHKATSCVYGKTECAHPQGSKIILFSPFSFAGMMFRHKMSPHILLVALCFVSTAAGGTIKGKILKMLDFFVRKLVQSVKKFENQ